MKKSKGIRQVLDILIKIITIFIVVFILYYISTITNKYIYDYFVFPVFSITIVFICGINVGRSLEKIKRNESIGYFTKKRKNEKSEDITEYIINDITQLNNNKKILKELADGDKVHVKTKELEEEFVEVIRIKKDEEK